MLDYPGERSSPLASPRLHDPAVGQRWRERCLLHKVEQPREDVVGGREQATVHEQRRGVEDIDDGRNCDGKRVDHAFERVSGMNRPAAKSGDRLVGSHRSPDGLGHEPGQGRIGRERLEAAAVATAATGPRRIDPEMAEFAGQAVRAGQQPAAAHHAEAETGAHVEHGEVGQPGRRPEHRFAEAQGVRFLEHPARHAEPPLEIAGGSLSVEQVDVR